MKLLFISLLLSLTGIIFFEEVNNFCLSEGASWTFSKITPYALLTLFGAILSKSISVVIPKRPLKYILTPLSFIIPFLIGFSLHPIYEGDFSKNGEPVFKNLSPKDFNQDGITVIAIPGCKYCFESIEKLKILKKRNPELNIHFVVCTSDTKLIQNYKKEAQGLFPVNVAVNPDGLVRTAKLYFPSFVLVRKHKPVYYWSNDQLGVRALDQIEEGF